MGRVTQDTPQQQDECQDCSSSAVCSAYTNAGRIFILDDGIEDEPLMRVRRDTGYAPPHPAPSYHAPKGRVGPVYTFVKTDPQANFKWGVRHRAGVQYGR